MVDLEFFTNERYQVLKCMADQQVPDRSSKLSIIPLSQMQIAGIVGLSKAKVNAIIGELKGQGYITQKNRIRGTYLLTDKALSMLSEIQGKRGI